MKRILYDLIQIVLLALTALLIGGRVWGSLWLYHGWPGATGVLATILGVDGERAYDAMTDEMSIICFVIVVVAWLAIKVGIRRRNRK